MLTIHDVRAQVARVTHTAEGIVFRWNVTYAFEASSHDRGGSGGRSFNLPARGVRRGVNNDDYLIICEEERA